jgi:hypothetical protein
VNNDQADREILANQSERYEESLGRFSVARTQGHHDDARYWAGQARDASRQAGPPGAA